jgi:hypothetical protein
MNKNRAGQTKGNPNYYLCEVHTPQNILKGLTLDTEMSQRFAYEHKTARTAAHAETRPWNPKTAHADTRPTAPRPLSR